MCALCVSSHDCSHIHKAGGKIFIFDQLAWTLPRAVAPSYSLVHESAHRYRGILARLQGPHTATPNPLCNPRAESWNRPDAARPASATKSNARSCLVIKKILVLKKKFFFSQFSFFLFLFLPSLLSLTFFLP